MKADPFAPADHACRADLLEQGKAGEWQSANAGSETHFGADYFARHPSGWAVMHRRFRTPMRWAAALLAHRGDEAATQAFFDSILGFGLDRLGMRWLDLADLLVEYEGSTSQAAAGLKGEVRERLGLLAEVGSGRLRGVVVEKARALGLELGVNGHELPEERFVADLSP